MKMPSHCSVFVLGSKFCHLWCVLKYCVLFSPELSANFLFSFFTIKILFIYIFISLFLAVLGLCCCVQAFSHWGEWGLLSRCGMWASPCGGFSCCKAKNSSGVGSIVVAHRLSCPVARGIFPGWTIKLVFPALAGEFLPLDHQGNPSLLLLWKSFLFSENNYWGCLSTLNLMCHILLEGFLGGAQFSSVTQSCPTLCNPLNHSTPGLPVHHPLLEFTQTHVPWVGDAIQAAHPLLSPSTPAFNLSQHQGLFQWVSSSHQVAKVLDFQLQHQSFQWTFRTDIL